jgi:tetratricopeptide (TPR) repeat protein
MRARRLDPSAAALAAIVLAATGYWLVHTSVDWLFPYPAVTAPLIALLGSGCALAVRRPAAPGGARGRGWRLALVAALALLAVSAVPPFLSARYVDDAYAEWRDDLQRAYDDLDRAHTLNPLNNLPLLAEASIANAAGDRDRALAALQEAEDLRPEEWATHYLIAQLHAKDDPALAREQIRIALELNPLDRTIAALADKLGVRPANQAAGAG